MSVAGTAAASPSTRYCGWTASTSRRGSSISILGQSFTATEDDHLLVVSTACGDDEFLTVGDATAAAKAGTWTVIVGHVPSRTPGAAAGQVLVGNEPVTQAELDGYRHWRAAFDRGQAGIFRGCQVRRGPAASGVAELRRVPRTTGAEGDSASTPLRPV